jgi:hypothetical protein
VILHVPRPGQAGRGKLPCRVSQSRWPGRRRCRASGGLALRPSPPGEVTIGPRAVMEAAAVEPRTNPNAPRRSPRRRGGDPRSRARGSRWRGPPRARRVRGRRRRAGAPVVTAASARVRLTRGGAGASLSPGRTSRGAPHLHVSTGSSRTDVLGHPFERDLSRQGRHRLRALPRERRRSSRTRVAGRDRKSESHPSRTDWPSRLRWLLFAHGGDRVLRRANP